MKGIGTSGERAGIAAVDGRANLMGEYLPSKYRLSYSHHPGLYIQSIVDKSGNKHRPRAPPWPRRNSSGSQWKMCVPLSDKLLTRGRIPPARACYARPLCFGGGTSYQVCRHKSRPGTFVSSSLGLRWYRPVGQAAFAAGRRRMEEK